MFEDSYSNTPLYGIDNGLVRSDYRMVFDEEKFKTMVMATNKKLLELSVLTILFTDHLFNRQHRMKE